jgi:hypothetical protein
MKDFQQNIVPALGQNKEVYYPITESEHGLRILFVGNSITKHQPKPSIGWERDCGMAASCEERDYVHLLLAKMQNESIPVTASILKVAPFEWGFQSMAVEDMYAQGRGFAADIVIMFFGANVDKTYDVDPNPPKTFGQAYEELRNWLDVGHTRFFHSQGYYIRPKLDEEKQAIAEKHGDVFINIEDIRNRAETHGMYNHPNDLGMQEIADRFWEAMKADIVRE